jgi:hypothetical protein
MFSACSDNNDDPEIVNTTNAPVPAGSSLLVDKNFQYFQSTAWNKTETSAGYAGEALISDTEEFSLTETYYNGLHNDTVLFAYHDVAVNVVDAVSADAEPGYLEFNNKAARGGAADPYVELTGARNPAIPYVSVLQFTLTGLDATGDGLTVYISAAGGAYTSIGTFKPAETLYSIAINTADVKLKFAPAANETGYLAMPDLKIYNKGVPAGSVLYVDDLFRKWSINGYATPYPEPIAKAGTNLVPLANADEPFEYTKTITYYTGVPVTYTIHNGANYPLGYNHHGDTTLVYGLSTGYIQLSPNVNASLTISAVPSVSLIEFWIAAAGMQGSYHIYKSVGGGEYQLYREVNINMYAGVGRYFRYFINEKNVSFRFTPKPGFAGTPKIYGVKIWSDGKP